MNILDIQHVSWVRNKNTILHDVNWTVESGQHWVLMGANGSGKTTVLNMVTGYLWPTTGSVEVLGCRFGQCDVRELRKQIGWVSSSFAEKLVEALPNESAHDVVVSGKFASIGLYYENVSEGDKAQAMDLLKRFGGESFAHKPFSLLSQGQKQRVLIARAFMANPQLLILDEPCSGLDVLAREQLLQSLQQFVTQAQRQVPTIVYVTHHTEEVLPFFTHVLLLKNGTVVAAGPKEDVLRNETLSETLGIGVEISWQNGRPWVAVSEVLTVQ
ncbi:ABC transporter ATP-binding protein [Alicyclobacillus tolerans]|uniref:ABC transporter ATP-binding protein n=1 Tax=Alicyclobacillus tolerans TaxID=90970 RepID=UPI001F276ADE|nr:ABC transporter ATP-binding protein [Alicyclobacillus tolerans]MCF8564537.1 ABC transporter ATP-binding protein [Alicyclobacillus tolerans]